MHTLIFTLTMFFKITLPKPLVFEVFTYFEGVLVHTVRSDFSHFSYDYLLLYM